jgi:homoserine kinase type II
MAVYTRVTDEEVAAFTAGYGLGRVLALDGITEGVENTNYRLETERGRFILTLYEKRVAPADLPFFLDLMEHLAAAGIGCPTPLRDAAGRNLGTLAGRPAAVTTFLAGAWPRVQTAEHCHSVGRALAELHRAGRSFPGRRTNALGLAGWRPLYERFAARADEIVPGLARLIEGELAVLEAAWPRMLPEGVIHADLFPDNVFFIDSRLSGLIDFYFACTDALAYDVAVCLNAWCFTSEVTVDRAKGAALLAGYESVRALEPAERAALPMLARGAALRFLLTRAYDWLNTPASALVAPHDPGPYMKRLEVHRGVNDAATYGLAVTAS